MLAIFVSLLAEQRSLQRHLPVVERAQVDGLPVLIGRYAGKGVLLCRTGLGQRALAVANAVFARYPPRSVLSLGFAGGVVGSLKGGDILVCERVYLYQRGEKGVQAADSDERLVALAEAAAQRSGAPYRKGNSSTVARVLGRPAEKAEIARQLPVQIVEMESYWLGQAARQRGVPFLAVRVVTDTLGDVVPEASGLLSETGTVRWGRLILYLGAHPGGAFRLLKLTPNMLRARRHLSAFAREFLSLWGQEP